MVEKTIFNEREKYVDVLGALNTINSNLVEANKKTGKDNSASLKNDLENTETNNEVKGFLGRILGVQTKTAKDASRSKLDKLEEKLRKMNNIEKKMESKNVLKDNLKDLKPKNAYKKIIKPLELKYEPHMRFDAKFGELLNK